MQAHSMTYVQSRYDGENVPEEMTSGGGGGGALSKQTRRYIHTVHTRFECLDGHVESSDHDNGDESKVPPDDKHDGHTHQRPHQSHPAIVELERRTPP